MILDKLVAATKTRLVYHQKQNPLNALKHQAASLPAKLKTDFLASLKKPGFHIIAEVKKASPSKGAMVSNFSYLKIAQAYDQAGVDAISVLTEPDYFSGHLHYLKEISQKVSVPTLRKDFIIDPYMIYEAKANGASIILLIVAILNDQKLKSFRKLAESLGMQAIVEAYTSQEVIRAINSGAQIIGINNRNLKDFKVNLNHSLKLRHLIPKGIFVIAESGIKNHSEINKLANAGFNGALIGESLMKSQQKKYLVKNFKEASLGLS